MVQFGIAGVLLMVLWVAWQGNVDSYNTEIKRLAGKLLSLIAETLQLKPDFFEKKFGKPYQRMRMNYYPQCPTPDRVFGLSPHADMTGITLLLQDDEVVGLNVRKDDQC
jgi:isopenicillin N synthase-like dioxygenase